MTENIMELDLQKIHPDLRAVFSMEEIETICRAIRLQGQKEPIRVWFDGARFRILDGEKRWRACNRLGISRVKAIVVQSAVSVGANPDY